MSGDEDEACGSKTTNTTPRRSVQSKRRRSKYVSKELNDVEKEELARKFKETDQNLEKFAQAHNMTALNVKSVLRSVIKNHRALARVLGTDAPDESIDGVRITRSKTRALQDSSNQGVDMTSNVPIKRGNNWVDFSFNDDDEYDNDYRPDEDNSDDVGSDSTQLGSSDEETDHLSDFDGEGEKEDEQDDHQNLMIVDEFDDDYAVEIELESSNIPSRPRSAASLTLNAMMGEDDEPSIDYKVFVHNLNLDEIPYDEDDNEEDPEYMVPTDAIFRDDRDDFMGDYWSSTIPQKEMEDLIEDIVPSERLVELAKNLSPPLRQTEPTKTATAVEKRTVSPIGIPISNEKAGVKGGVFTENHRSQLRTQLEQHVQLLTQSFVGCYFEPLLQEEKEKAREMIEGLVVISSNTWHLGKKSAFHISNLSYAVETCNGMVDENLARPLRPLAKEHLTIPHSMLSLTKNVLSSSRAIIYPHLVSHHRLVQSIGSSGWSSSEIILFAMALNRHSEEPVKHKRPRYSKYSIMAENCLPWRTMNELRWQYNGMKRGLDRNGRTRHNREFFDIAEGKKKMKFDKPLRAKLGWTMDDWEESSLPPWFDLKSIDRRKEELIERRKGSTEAETTQTEKERIEEDDESDSIVIIDDDEEEDNNEMDERVTSRQIIESMEEEENGDEDEDERGTTKEKENMMKFSLDDDECAMDSMGMNGIKRSPEELEEVRGDEKEGDGQPIDFSHLMNEMSPAGPSHVKTPPRRRDRSNTPNEKTIFPPTPGKRIASPSEESMPWMDMIGLTHGFDTPPPCQYSPTSSRIKTPGGTVDYVDSLMGYFGSPEREIEYNKGTLTISPSKRANTYSNLFGDFDFDESDGDEEIVNLSVKEESVKRMVELEERPESSVITMEYEENTIAGSRESAPVKQKHKRRTREEKEKLGMAAMKDIALRRRIMNALAKKTAEDIRARMTMHSSIFKQIQNIVNQTIERKDRAKMLENMLPVLGEHHKEVLYLVSSFVPPSSLPRLLVIDQRRQSYVAAINIICTIYAYMSKIQRKLSYRQLLRIIVDAHSKGGTENVLSTLEGVLSKDPLLLRVLTEYYTPAVPPKKSRVWESIDLRKGDEAFNIFKEDGRAERIDLCEVMGAALTKRRLVKARKPLSSLMLNNDGEPLLRNKDGKYKGIAVWSEHQIEEERKNKAMEKEIEKKTKQREKTKERMKAVKKAKMVSKREERAREKKKEKERIQEEEERKKEEKEAPPTHPFTRDMDKALLLLYNEVQKVTKRAVRKMAVDIPYSSNFTLEQLQSRLDFLLALAKED